MLSGMSSAPEFAVRVPKTAELIAGQLRSRIGEFNFYQRHAIRI